MNNQGSIVLNLNFLNDYSLADDIYLRIDKLQSLCFMQTMLNSGDFILDTDVRFH